MALLFRAALPRILFAAFLLRHVISVMAAQVANQRVQEIETRDAVQNSVSVAPSQSEMSIFVDSCPEKSSPTSDQIPAPGGKKNISVPRQHVAQQHGLGAADSNTSLAPQPPPVFPARHPDRCVRDGRGRTWFCRWSPGGG